MARDKSRLLEALKNRMERGATAGEREAARRAYEKHKAKADADAKETPRDFFVRFSARTTSDPYLFDLLFQSHRSPRVGFRGEKVRTGGREFYTGFDPGFSHDQRARERIRQEEIERRTQQNVSKFYPLSRKLADYDLEVVGVESNNPPNGDILEIRCRLKISR